MCLPLDPEFPDNKQTGFHSGSYIYGVEYEKWNSDIFFADVHNQDAPCAVCEVQGRSQVLMIPAKKDLPRRLDPRVRRTTGVGTSHSQQWRVHLRLKRHGSERRGSGGRYQWRSSLRRRGVMWSSPMPAIHRWL